MSNSNDLKEERVDRLSQLPEPLLLLILSFLPIKFAVRTSLLACRFRHLWTASSSLELDRSDFPSARLFNNATNSCLSLHNPSVPLLRFCIKTNSRPISIQLISNWLNRAHSLGLRDLSLHIHNVTIESLFPLVLSFGSLHSLFINAVDLTVSRYCSRLCYPLGPTTFTSPPTQLKYLNLKAKMPESDLTTFIMGQRNLEYLCIDLPNDTVDLSSQSVKILKLSSERRIDKIYLSFPKLEFLDLSITEPRWQFHGEITVLRKALVEIETLSLWGEYLVPGLGDILKYITSVSELTLCIGRLSTKDLLTVTHEQKLNGIDIFRSLVELGKDMLMFSNLRSLELSMWFCENAIQDLICLLHYSPVIDSLHLIDLGPDDDTMFFWDASKVWHSKLPLNYEGNRKYAYFSNLQTGDKKTEVIKLLSSSAVWRRREGDQKKRIWKGTMASSTIILSETDTSTGDSNSWDSEEDPCMSLFREGFRPL